MWKWIVLTITLLFFIITISYIIIRNCRGSLRVWIPSNIQRPILMLIIDSLMDEPLKEAIHTGKAPALAFLLNHGYYEPKLISSFPTMSICIDSTLMTGSFPNQHKIYGLSYYHEEEGRMINAGTGAWESIVFGLKRVLTDSICNLNQKLLSPQVQTIHEAIDGPTASIGATVYRGNQKHVLKIPRLAYGMGILPQNVETVGPEIFSFGSLSQISSNAQRKQPWFRYGMNDRFTQTELVSLIQHQQLPAFTIVYFSGNDSYVHRKGASEIQGILKTDQELQAILNAFPSWEEAVQNYTWVILGDSGQATMIPDRKKAYLDMRKLLHPFRIMPLKRNRPNQEDQIVLCVNERMAYIYLVDPQVSMKEVVRICRQEQRLDLIAWNEKGWIRVVSGQKPGTFQYQEGGDFVDCYQQRWKIRGDAEILDLDVQDQEIHYGVYPDVLARLAGVIDTSERVIIVTIAPGHEMVGESSPKHKGGAHGSLHYTDSYVPMIVCGTDHEPPSRIIDIKNWILQLLQE